MTWQIEWYDKALKNLEDLPVHIRERVVKRIDMVKENPFHFLEHFERKGFYKLRIGDYRAIASVDFQNKIIKIQVFDHRGRIYKRLY
ncbi:MAG: type II toxin-antitoxin system RelE/ParE family toxin [Candidatus Aenigmarchaeota archaeon]|nr:type II toxin-antitoxin system RelE/ParE family toxin [Candidatus Aenigmarchaeota archaeon]